MGKEICLSLFVSALLGLVGCGTLTELQHIGETPYQTNAIASPTTSNTTLPIKKTQAPTPIPQTGWTSVRSGLDRRIINILDDQGNQAEVLYLLRFGSKDFVFRVAYNSEPRSLNTWQSETNALVIVNGGYFRVENGAYLPTGLLVANGKTIGSSYGPFAGMFAVSNTGPEVRWLSQKPYKPSEPLLFALQSFPVLVKPGGVLGFPPQSEDNEKSRRTVVAQDKQGRLLFIVAPYGYFTLYQLASYLIGSGLDLNIALNLDGGTSSGILLSDPHEEISPLTPLPVVITVHPR